MSIRLLTGVQSIRTCLCEIEIKFSFFSHFITICFFTNLFQSSQRYMIFSVITLHCSTELRCDGVSELSIQQ